MVRRDGHLRDEETDISQVSRAEDELEHARSSVSWLLAAFCHSGVREATTRMLAVVPPRLQDDLEGDDYATHFSKFEAFLNGKRRSGEAPLSMWVGSKVARHYTGRPRLLGLGLESDGGWRDEWLALECDSVVARDRCYRLALHWLLCSGHVVGDFYKQ